MQKEQAGKGKLSDIRDLCISEAAARSSTGEKHDLQGNTKDIFYRVSTNPWTFFRPTESQKLGVIPFNDIFEVKYY